MHTIQGRSFNMSRIRGSDTKPELIVRKFLHSRGFRFLLHNKKLPGKPDLTLPKYQTVIFVNGCFWHGHKDCKYFVLPQTRTEWWKQKIESTIIRDRNAKSLLNEMGWNVITVWECELKSARRVLTLDALYRKISNKDIIINE